MKKRLGRSIALTGKLRAAEAQATPFESTPKRLDGLLVYRLTYNDDVAAGQLAVFQGASEAPLSGFIRVERATRKNSQPAAARRVALKMGRRLRCSSVTSRTSLRGAEANQTATGLKLVRDAPSSRLADGPF